MFLESSLCNPASPVSPEIVHNQTQGGPQIPVFSPKTITLYLLPLASSCSSCSTILGKLTSKKEAIMRITFILLQTYCQDVQLLLLQWPSAVAVPKSLLLCSTPSSASLYTLLLISTHEPQNLPSAIFKPFVHSVNLAVGVASGVEGQPITPEVLASTIRLSKLGLWIRTNLETPGSVFRLILNSAGLRPNLNHQDLSQNNETRVRSYF